MTSRGRLADDVCRRIADDIVLGRFAPGERLEEVALAEQFSVSRTPIREALKQLSIMGLVECRPNRGSVVASISADELTHMFETIGELEAACARYAAMRMTEHERQQLSTLHAEGRAAMQARDMVRYDEHNGALHTLILRGSHNPVLIETAQALRHRVAPYRRTQFVRLDRVTASYAEHCGIVEAIMAGDAVAAYREMRSHVSSAHEAAAGMNPVFATTPHA
jgi:DNA-binding GntR family transcriptional regulator